MIAFEPLPLHETWFLTMMGLFFGMIFGSFITMLCYRLPRGLSIVYPRSECPHCHTKLGVPDLIPVFSWLFLKGHCRHCGAPIGARYVVIEIITTMAFITLALCV